MASRPAGDVEDADGVGFGLETGVLEAVVAANAEAAPYALRPLARMAAAARPITLRLIMPCSFCGAVLD
jgi:hypothetical protein